ncbi:hypothetical protein N9M65_00485 [Luminiphilus sp.]|nr:hypothetical protein [Luminiphilus sp.]
MHRFSLNPVDDGKRESVAFVGIYAPSVAIPASLVGSTLPTERANLAAYLSIIGKLPFVGMSMLRIHGNFV